MTCDISRTQAYLWLAALVLIFIYACVDGTGIWHPYVDHIMTLRIAEGKNIPEVVQFSLSETHPPLGYLLLHFWLSLSDNPYFMKSLSLLFGIGVLGTGYAIGVQLGDRFTGLCTAALFAASNAVLVQSYIYRSYTILLFFLLLQLLLWLRWRKEQKTSLLYGYALAGLAAICTHFSALFATLVIASYDTLSHRSKRTMSWYLANAVLVAVSLALYAFWLPIITYYKTQSGMASGFLIDTKTILDGILYAPKMLMYTLPAPEAGLAALYLLMLLSAFPYCRSRYLLSLMWWALATGTLLYVSGLYPVANQRRSLWIMPFIIPPAACVLAEIMRYVQLLLNKLGTFAWHHIFCGLLLLGVVGLHKAQYYRFLDIGEFSYTEQAWQDYENYLKALPSNALVIAGRFDSLLIAPKEDNIYHHFADRAQKGDKDFAVMPLYGAHLYYNTFYWWIKTNERLELFADQLAHDPRVAQKDTLIFVKGVSDVVTYPYLICPELQKKVTYFPARNGNSSPRAREGSNNEIIAVEISRKEFFEALMAPGGRAHHCMPDTKH